MHVDDLKPARRRQVGFDYSMSGPVGNWQELFSLQAQINFSCATKIERGSEWLRLLFPKRSSKNNSAHIKIILPPGGWNDESVHPAE